MNCFYFLLYVFCYCFTMTAALPTRSHLQCTAHSQLSLHCSCSTSASLFLVIAAACSAVSALLLPLTMPSFVTLLNLPAFNPDFDFRRHKYPRRAPAQLSGKVASLFECLLWFGMGSEIVSQLFGSWSADMVASLCEQCGVCVASVGKCASCKDEQTMFECISLSVLCL